nr:hypothetical protein [Tanacetum cinerariifolium]
PTLSRLHTGPEEPEQAQPSSDYIPGPEHADDEIVAEDQPEDRPDVTLPPQKRLGIALGPRYELGGYVREFETRVRQDTDEIYIRLDDEQIERQLLAGRLNMLFRDRRAYAYTRHLMDTEARMSREAWVRATDASDLVHGKVMSLRTTVLGQMSEIKELQAANRWRQTVILELLRIDHRRSTEITELRTALQGHVTALQGQVTALQAQVTTLQGQQGLAGGTEGVASLSQWCERMESVFHISNCATENQVKFATCTLHSVVLTWWNTHVQTVGHEAAYGMSWKALMKMMTEKYCPQNEIRKLEMELWDLKVKGLPDMIHGSVVASKSKTMQEAIEIATELMDKKIRTFAERETESKKKFENTSRNTQNQQQQHSNKRQNTGRVYTTASGEKKQYGGSKPLCAKCNNHHDGPRAPKCHNCNKIGHFARDCRSAASTNNANNQKGTGLGQRPACYECEVQGHFKRECPKLKNNNNHGNQGGRNNAPARVYAVGRAGTDPDANVMTDHCYDVELADGRIIRLNTIHRGCTLNLLNHPFNIDLIPVELGSFDAIIGMDWLAKYQAVIVCAEKIVHIPWGNETLIIHGASSNQGNATRLSIISCTKTEKYMKKGFPIFLAHITTKEVED